MDDVSAIMLIEDPPPGTTEEELTAAWQRLIDTGLAWGLQGYYGRTAERMIQEGRCVAPNPGDRACGL
jgi:hypothetical protein